MDGHGWIRDVIGTEATHRSSESAVNVDDPLESVIGNKASRGRATTMILTTWLVLGFPLVKWIGTVLTIAADAMPAGKIAEINDSVAKFLSVDVLPVKEVRFFAGKAMHIAPIIYVWRPFLSDVWGALSDLDKAKGPKNCIWTKQIKRTLIWWGAFWDGKTGTLVLTVRVDSYCRKGSRSPSTPRRLRIALAACS